MTTRVDDQHCFDAGCIHGTTHVVIEAAERQFGLPHR